MSDLPAIFKNTDLSIYKEALKENDNLSSGMFDAVPSIRIEGKMFVVYENKIKTINAQSFSAVIVAAGGISKKYYAQAYSGKEQAAPDCYSIHGDKPSSNSESPQCDLCANCSHNTWSADGGRKKCSDFRRLVVCVLNDNSPTGYVLYRLDIPPASLKNLQIYGKLLSRNSAPMFAVMTKFGFDQNESYSKITFEPIEVLDKKIVDTVIMTAKSDPVVAKTLGSDDVQHKDMRIQVSQIAAKAMIDDDKLASSPVEFDDSLDAKLDEAMRNIKG